MHLVGVALFWAAYAVAGAVVAYLVLLTAASFVAPARSPAKRIARTRFALLVPAHNEEAMIAGALASLRGMDYPERQYRVFVVADNCTDATAAIARQHGVEVYERFDTERRGKGHALEWLLARIAGRPEVFDAFVIFDADSRVDPSFLRVMDAELGRRDEVLQAHYAVLNPKEGTGAALRAAAMALVNYVRPLGKNALGCSTLLKGNGMCFPAYVLAKHGWGAYGLTEDAEMGVRLLLAGVPVRFVPTARVWAQMPPDLGHSGSQNMRWESGRLLVARQWVPALLLAGVRRGSATLLEMAVDLAVPPLSVVAGAVALLAGATLALPWLHGARPAATLLAGALAFHVIAGLHRARVPAGVWRALLHAPAYSLWKLALYARALAGRTPTAWVRTRRFPG